MYKKEKLFFGIFYYIGTRLSSVDFFFFFRNNSVFPELCALLSHNRKHQGLTQIGSLEKTLELNQHILLQT